MYCIGSLSIWYLAMIDRWWLKWINGIKIWHETSNLALLSSIYWYLMTSNFKWIYNSGREMLVKIELNKHLHFLIQGMSGQWWIFSLPSSTKGKKPNYLVHHLFNSLTMFTVHTRTYVFNRTNDAGVVSGHSDILYMCPKAIIAGFNAFAYHT